MHIEVLDEENVSVESRKLKEKNLRAFQVALCNRTISEYILGTYFPDESCTEGR
jgi:hypothetical protein